MVGGGPFPRQLLPFLWEAPCRAEAGPFLHPAGGSLRGPHLQPTPPSVGSDSARSHLMEDCQHQWGPGAGRPGQGPGKAVNSSAPGSRGDTAVWPGGQGAGVAGGERPGRSARPHDDPVRSARLLRSAVYTWGN